MFSHILLQKPICALALAATLTSIVGCAKSGADNAVVPQITAIKRAPHNALTEAAFKGKYAGGFMLRLCNASLGPGPISSGQFDFGGTGAARLSLTHELGTANALLRNTGESGLCSPWSGHVKLSDAQSNSITVHLGFLGRHAATWRLRWHVVTGTGKFQYATGQGTSTMVTTITSTFQGLSRGSYTDSWTGTISY
jgi:hypothetical protein